MRGCSGKVIEAMRYIKITSPANQNIRDAIRIRDRHAKFRHSAFLIEGPHLVEAALNARVQVKEVFATRAFIDKKEHRGLLVSVSKFTEVIFEVTDNVLLAITDTETPQGIVAIAGYEPQKLETLVTGTVPFFVVLDGIQDPGNLGTIIRTADAAGADAVILLAGTCDAFIPKVIRATAGSIFNIPIVNATSDDFLDWLRSHNIKLAVTAADAQKTVFDAELKKPIALVFGNEAHGVREAVRKAADMVLSIPVLGKAESLNVATSAAVCLYEAVRQRFYESN